MDNPKRIAAPDTVTHSARPLLSRNTVDDEAIEAVRSVVFGTAELLEQILLQVDMKTVLLSQHVSSQWRNLITDSPTLQKKLFSKPATFAEVRDFAQADEDRGTVFVTLTPDYGARHSTRQTQPTAVINPLLFRARMLCPGQFGHEQGALHGNST